MAVSIPKRCLERWIKCKNCSDTSMVTTRAWFQTVNDFVGPGTQWTVPNPRRPSWRVLAISRACWSDWQGIFPMTVTWGGKIDPPRSFASCVICVCIVSLLRGINHNDKEQEEEDDDGGCVDGGGYGWIDLDKPTSKGRNAKTTHKGTRIYQQNLKGRCCCRRCRGDRIRIF